MTIPATKTQPRYSVEEYLVLEEAAVEKHEFHDGEIIAMSGGTYEQSRIISNILVAMAVRLKGSPCFVLESNMRIAVAKKLRYLYPDATIVCDGPVFDPRDKRRTTINNPRVIVEVLSESTEAHDRGTKFGYYRELDSMEEYVLVSQSRPMIETYLRQPDHTWSFAAWQGVEDVAALRAVAIDLPLAEVYSGLTFPQDEPPAEASAG